MNTNSYIITLLALCLQLELVSVEHLSSVAENSKLETLLRHGERLPAVPTGRSTNGTDQLRGETKPAPRGGRFKREMEHVYTALDVRINEEDGEPIAKTAWEKCETEKSCSISHTISHTITVTSTISAAFGLEATDIFRLTSLSFSLSRAVAEGKATSYSFQLDSPGEGRLMFTPRLLRIRGRFKKDARAYCAGEIMANIFSLGVAGAAGLSMPGVNCLGRHEDEVDMDLLAPLREAGDGVSGDQIQGTWWVQYRSDPNPVDTDNFHVIRHKDIPGLVDLYDMRSGTPKMCARSALDRGHNFAVWRDGRCYFKRTEDGVGRLTSRFAKPIGEYNLPIDNSKSSASSSDRDEWVRQGHCDMIQEYEGYGYYCKTFADSRDTVMMFRRSKKYMGDAGNESVSKAVFHPDNNKF